MKTAGIFFNAEKTKARAEMLRLKKWLQERKCRIVVLPSTLKKLPVLDFAVTLGGDGTMLKASKLFAPLGVPVLAINLGSLGFLAETDPQEAYGLLEHVLSDTYQVEERMMLTVTIKTRTKKIIENALNDCIVHSGNNGRIISVQTKANNEFLADYVGDGVIIATPTGSTAYSLAASGPIVLPHLSVFILTPICPHTLTQRPMIVSTHHTLTLQAFSADKRQRPILSLDGQTSFQLTDNDTVTITESDTPLQLIINPERKYFQVLRTKL
jgi:NAD+ kinase